MEAAPLACRIVGELGGAPDAGGEERARVISARRLIAAISGNTRPTPGRSSRMRTRSGTSSVSMGTVLDRPFFGGPSVPSACSALFTSMTKRSTSMSLHSRPKSSPARVYVYAPKASSRRKRSGMVSARTTPATPTGTARTAPCRCLDPDRGPCRWGRRRGRGGRAPSRGTRRRTTSEPRSRRSRQSSRRSCDAWRERRCTHPLRPCGRAPRRAARCRAS